MDNVEKAEEPHPPEAPEEGMIVKPHCECTSCSHWTKTADWCPPTTLQFENENKKVLEEKQLNPLMRSEKHPGKFPNIRTYNPQGLTKIEIQAVFKTLVQGEVIPEPVQTCTETYFSEDLQKSLELLNYKYTLPLQSFAWSAIFRLMNVFLVGGAKSGKTLSYLPAMCTFATTTEVLAKHKGPCVVIICSNSKQCEEIFDLIKTICKNVKNRPKVAIITYPIPNIHSTDILISIPESLLHCLKTRIFNLKRLCHLVLEDASTMLQNDESSIYKILEVVDDVLEHRTTNTMVQLIATSEKWTSGLKKLLQSVYTTPLVCVGNHLEAALYGNINFEIKFLMSSQKLEYLESILKDKYYDYKTVVICDQAEVVEVNKWLVRKGIRILALSSESSKEEMEQYELEWSFTDNGCHKVLLCTDLVFDSLLRVNNAMWLINFSFPASWTRFTKRYSLLSAHYKSPLDPNKDRVQCKSVVLIDENCEKEMARILNLVSRLGNEMPSSCQQYAEGFREKTEMEKIATGVELCPTLKLFGRCHDNLCEKRHLLSPDSDVSESLPKSGKIKFRVLNMTDVTEFSVQLLEHVDLKGNVTKINDDDLSQPLNYGDNVEIQRPAQIKIGGVYAHCEYTTTGEVYMLCHVISIQNNNVEVRLKNGVPMQTALNRLFNLPPNLTVVDVKFSNLVPPFKDSSFSGRSFFAALTSLQNLELKKMILTGRINLQLDNTFWLDEVVQMFNVDGTDVVLFDIIKHLIKLRVAEPHPGQISSLYKLCNNCDIVLPTYARDSVKKVVKIKDVEPQMAFLDDNIHEVILSCAYSPDEFYVRLAKFQALLENLEKDILRTIESEVLPKISTVEIGKYYLAPDRQGTTYSRVKVQEVEKGKVLCFHVDYGDESVVDISTLKMLPTKLLTRLPFQAIRCRLFGLSPSFGEWDEESTDVLYKYMFEPDSDIFRSLYVEMRSKDGDKGSVKYSVSLKDGYDENRQVLINQLLLDCGLATSMFAKIDDFEIPQPPVVEESDEGDVGEERGVDSDEDFIGPMFDLEIIDIEEFFEMLTGVSAKEYRQAVLEQGEENTEEEVTPKPKKKSKATDVSFEECPETKPDYFTPEVLWCQTEKTLRLKIKLIGVEDYKINVVLKKILTFSTTVDEKPYKLKLTLHDRVTLERHRAVGQEVIITLNKVETGDWPQLTNSAKRMRNIHYEISEHEKEEPKKKILQLDITDDESSGEDDNVMYVVESDMESDYDCDQPYSDSDENY